jgi:hypothetical protein
MRRSGFLHWHFEASGGVTMNNWKNVSLAERLREIRKDMYGDQGGQSLADALAIPLGTWLNYESGVVMPASVVLKLIALASVNPHWLLNGQGERYDRRSWQIESSHNAS